MQSNRHAVRFGRALWLGNLVNLLFVVPAILTPRVFVATAGLGNMDPVQTIWLRNSGMLLLLLCGFYANVARDPLSSLPFARWAVASRFIAAGFWLWLLWVHEMPAVLWWLFAADLALGLLQFILLRRALTVSPPLPAKPWRRSLYDRAYAWTFRNLERLGIQWYRLWPALLGSIASGGLRRDLRGKNLHAPPGDVPDSDESRIASAKPDYLAHPLPEWHPSYRSSRSPDGSFNDLESPEIGMVGMRFGRNMPIKETWPKVPPEGDSDAGIPSPREVSRELLARPVNDQRPQFTPATTLNLLAAAWIQFQNHGWFSHRIPKPTVDHSTGQPVVDDPSLYASIRLDPDKDRDFIEWSGSKVMFIRRSVPDPTRPANAPYPPSFRNTESHWWDASQIYGARLETQMSLRQRAHGKLKVQEATKGKPELTLLLPDPDAGTLHGEPGIDLTGFNDNYWVGLSLMHTLFVREHNYLCDELFRRYGDELAGLDDEQQDEWLFGKSRLIVAGLMAKIHTIEWTPGILGHPILRIDMDSNWWGILGRWFKIRFGRVSENEGISGIIGSQAEHHAAPYALTEEFVSVYRMHPLVPDFFPIFRLGAGTSPVGEERFEDVQGVHTRQAVAKYGLTDWFLTFGKQHPGAITLRNFPECLRRFERNTGQKLDLATVDIFRDRERGIPPYNRFREMLRMSRISSFDELVGHRPDREYLVTTLRRLYGQTDGRDNVDKLDLMVGLFAEKLPPGFGFSDTAFRIFILMASRRLKSDRFFTDDFRPETYTQFGIDWLNHETMSSLLVRHYPSLEAVIPKNRNPFAPW